MNIIWLLLIIAGVLFSIGNGKAGLELYTKALFDGGKVAVEISLMLLGIVSLWMGITKIIEDSGLIHKFARFFKPAILRLFKGIPDDHPAISSITLNFLANLFGLGNAATPLGIKAMQDLQTLNKGEQDTITFEMMLFIVINTASIQILPFSVIGILAAAGSTAPTAIVLPTIIVTLLSAVFAVMTLFVFRRVFKWK